MKLFHTRWLGCGIVLAAVACLSLAAGAAAADPAFVGKLALAVDPGVSAELGLSDEVKTKLIALIDARENEALELVAEIKDLPQAEREAKLAPFVAESEKQGQELLSEEQRTKLSQLSVARAGMLGLADPKLAVTLNLNDEQKAQLAKLIAEYQQVLATGSDTQKQYAKGFYEKKIAALLTDNQKAEWEKMSGVPAGAAAQPAAATTAQAGPGGPSRFSPPGGGPPGPGGAAGPGGANPPRYTGAVVSTDGKLRFNFKFAPYRDVIDWFCQQAGLSLANDDYPPGTFNYTDTRAYTPEEALDVLNTILATKGYTLVRREKMAILFNLENGPVPTAFVPVVAPEELDKLGEFELVSCLFQLTRLTPEEAELEINKLKGPQGSVVVLGKSKQVYVTEHAGKLRTISAMLQAVENPAAPKDEKVAVLKLQHLLPSEFMEMARTLLGIPPDATATPDGTLRLAVDELGGKVIVSGKQASIERVEELAKVVDVAGDALPEGGTIFEQPQLEVYPITQADADGVLAVLQTLMAGDLSIRLAKDPKTGSIVAYAKPSQLATIKATIDQMQSDGSKTEVIKLRTMDPAEAVLAINQLFGDPTGKDPIAAANAPKLFADSYNMELTIRGTPAQLAQVREWLTQKGEVTPEGTDLEFERPNFRTLPASERTAARALEQLEFLWPATGRKNKINIRTPSNRNGEQQPQNAPRGRTGDPEMDAFLDSLGIRPEEFRSGPAVEPPAREGERESGREGDDEPAIGTGVEQSEASLRAKPSGRAVLIPIPKVRPPKSADEPAEAEAKPASEPAAAPAAAETPTTTQTTRAAAHTQFVAAQLAVQAPSADKPAEAAPPTEKPAEPAAAEKPASTEAAPTDPAPNQPAPTEPAATEATTDRPAEGAAGAEVAAPEVTISVGPGGITIVSEDLDALDEMESLLRTVVDSQATGKEFNIYYLRYAKAETAAGLLTEIMGGAGAGAADEGGGGLMGDIASQMIGGMGGDLLGGLLGGPAAGGSTTVTAGAPSIIPDPRLNALVVQATARDLDSIEQLLDVIDRPDSGVPIETQPSPRFIAVRNGNAQDIATIVRQVYAGRMAADASQPRQPSPEDFIRALSGGRGGRGGGGGSSRQQNRGEEQKMTIGVDATSNSLIVSAPEYLFYEVEALVKRLDQAAVKTDETVRVVTLKRTSTDLVQRSLVSVLGANATVNKTASTTTSPSSSTSRTTSSSSQGSRSGSSSNQGGDNRQPDGGNQDSMRRFMESQEMIRRFQEAAGSRGGGDRGGGDRGGGSSRGGFGGDRGSSRGGFGRP